MEKIQRKQIPLVRRNANEAYRSSRRMKPAARQRNQQVTKALDRELRRDAIVTLDRSAQAPDSKSSLSFDQPDPLAIACLQTLQLKSQGGPEVHIARKNYLRGPCGGLRPDFHGGTAQKKASIHGPHECRLKADLHERSPLRDLKREQEERIAFDLERVTCPQQADLFLRVLSCVGHCRILSRSHMS
ncbi:hypothetical protein AC579_10446 [Pseudocercospora musae]|uniref:Uncharacterized protein n=1 Tax=Pseudocercospora musae TaxID=113226 RepID=A0A139ILD1_9PEZI|nr:hypothetical protein AC579_10446 [Pseudocercospora musae]